MRTLLATLIVMSTAGSVSAQDASPLGDERWRHRILLLFVPGPDVSALASFREQVQARRCDVTDRDLLIAEVIGMDSGSLDGEPLPPGRIRAVRNAHSVAAGRVATVLIGKDGGVKMVEDGVTELDQVFQRIDGMPMRRREMSERGTDPCL